MVRYGISDLLNRLELIRDRLDELFESYGANAWSLTTELISQRLNKPWAEISADDLGAILKDWQSNRAKLNNMILKDAEKEFDQNSRFGFGIDGDEAVRDLDFEAIRGAFDNNSLVKTMRRKQR